MNAPESTGAPMNEQENLTSLLDKAAKYRAMAQEAAGNKTLRDALEAVAWEYRRQAQALSPDLPHLREI
jgi:hypothetical protein